MLLKVKRLNELSRGLERQYNSAGWDLYPTSSGAIVPGTAKVIGLGFATEFDPAYVALILDRGSIGLKGCGRLAGVVDADYRGEWKVVLARYPLYVVEDQPNGVPIIQFGPDDEFTYSPEKAIAQVLFMPLADVSVEMVSELSLSARGDRMNGSSDHLVRKESVIEVGIGMKSVNMGEIQ